MPIPDDLSNMIPKTLYSRVILLTALTFVPANVQAAQPEARSTPATKPRILVLTDMGADPDDEQSLVRLLLYANQLDIEGIVATTSCWHQNSIRPDFIHKIVDAYGQVQPNLLQHEPGFPTAEDLRAVVKEGIPKYGMTGVGDAIDKMNAKEGDA